MPLAEEFCTREPHFEGEEVFGSMKRKLNLPPDSEYNSHKPDKVNFSCLCIELRSTKAFSNGQTSKDDPPKSTDDDNRQPPPVKEVTLWPV